jgi:hypothetical protein
VTSREGALKSSSESSREPGSVAFLRPRAYLGTLASGALCAASGSGLDSGEVDRPASPSMFNAAAPAVWPIPEDLGDLDAAQFIRDRDASLRQAQEAADAVAAEAAEGRRREQARVAALGDKMDIDQ